MPKVKQSVWRVLPRDDEWIVKKRGGSQASSVHQTKSAAVSKGKSLAKRNDGQVRVRNKNGKFAYERTYGNDPARRPG